MEARRTTATALLASFVLAALAAQAMVAVVESRGSPVEKSSQGDDGVKKPDCVPGMDPRSFPGIGGITPVTPSHGGSTTGTPPPSHHGGGYVPTPSHGGTTLPSPSPSHGGFGSSPSTSPSTGAGSPSHGGYGSSPTGGSPSHGGGAYGGSPSTPGGGGAYGGGSPTPAYGGSSSPSHGGGIGTSSPMPFVPMDPHSFGSLPGSCDYWRSHPMEILSAIGVRFPSTTSSTGTTMGHFFGAAGSVGGSDMSIQDALANTRSDGTGALLREGAAALLNSMTRARGFPYTTDQVRDAFAAAAAARSDGAAAAQAAAFKKANEGKA